MITVLESWSVVDKWWTDESERRNFLEVNWEGRVVVFVQIPPDQTWRIRLPDGRTESQSTSSAQEAR